MTILINLLPMILILTMTATIAVMVYRLKNKRNRLHLFDENVSQGELTFETVTERPIKGDKNGQAYCSFKGYIHGPDIPRTTVMAKLVLPMASLWPMPGQSRPVLYLAHDVLNTWQFYDTDSEV